MTRDDEEIDRASAGTRLAGRCGGADMQRCSDEDLSGGEDDWKETPCDRDVNVSHFDFVCSDLNVPCT